MAEIPAGSNDTVVIYDQLISEGYTAFKASNRRAIELMKADAVARVTFHLFTPKDGRLTAARVRDMVPDWRSASFWFCGPSSFAAALKHDLARQGLRPGDFHHELFKMR